MEKINRQLIEKVANKIKSDIPVLKIILFGSAVWGELSENSDLDLFVIMESDLRRDKRAIIISEMFSEREFPLDVIVYTPEEVESGLRRQNPFLRKVLAEGEVLYAA